MRLTAGLEPAKNQPHVFGSSIDRPGLTYRVKSSYFNRVSKGRPPYVANVPVKACPVLKFKIPASINKRWWGEIWAYAKPGTKVYIMEFYASVEVNLASNGHCVAQFRSVKHARQFCQLNGLTILKFTE